MSARLAQPIPSAYGTPPRYATQPGYRPVQPAYQPAPGRGSRKTLWIVITAIAVVLVAGIAAVAVTLVNVRDTISGVAAPSETRTAAPSGSGSGSPTSGAPAGGKTFAFGEAAQLTVDGEDAADITVGAPVEFTSTNQLDKPEKGRFVYVPVTMKVTGTEKVSINPFDFEVILPDGQRIDVAFVAGLPKDAPAGLDGADVNPGETITGSIPFDVPVGTPITVAYSPDLDVLGTWQ